MGLVCAVAGRDIWQLLTPGVTANVDADVAATVGAYGRSKRGQRITMLLSVLFFLALTVGVISACTSNLIELLRLGNIQLMFMLYPPAIYALFGALALAFNRRALRTDRAGLADLQHTVNFSFGCFIAAFVLSVPAVFYASHNPFNWMVMSLMSCIRDAGIACTCANWDAPFPLVIGGFAPFEDNSHMWAETVKFSLMIVCFFVLRRKATALALTLTDLIRRAAAGAGFGHALSAAVAAPIETIVIDDGNNWISNLLKSFWWLFGCYMFLFWFFGFSDGVFGIATQNLIIDSCADANLPAISPLDLPKMRLFCGAVFALYGTVPFAVMACNFLPAGRARSIVLGENGLTAPRGFGLAMSLLPHRLWSDFKAVDLIAGKKLKVQFYSGGSITIPSEKISPVECDRILSLIDEMAPRCHVSESVGLFRRNLQDLLKDKKPIRDNEIALLQSERFKSTLFVPFLPGHFLPGGLRVIKLLSSKPLSAVYLVRRDDGQLAVLKQFQLGGGDENLRQIFTREHNLLASLDNPNIARVLDVFEEADSSFILLQHWKGQDLRAKVESGGPLPASTVVEYARQLCRLMQYLHSRPQPILHRDLSPDNIILDERSCIKLIDFGAAKEFVSGVSGTLIGKQCYMAPEQVRGETCLRSDIYGFGCTLHFLLTGKDPRALAPSSPAQFENVPPWLDSLIRSCTAFDEADRPESFTALLEMFDAFERDTDKGYVIKINLKQPERAL